MFIIFWDILIYDQILFSPQVKQRVIISNKHGIYELPHELPNNLRLRKYQENPKVLENYNLVPSLPLKMKILSILAKNGKKKEIDLFL